ncbi:MAG TPA: c-type cytochrome [Bryobacteraceae bacterium]|nr:c-type cytochrome [Bryobacteraceae bacterium]
MKSALLLGAAVCMAFADAGEDAYNRLCGGCHGEKGVGARGPTLAVERLVRAPDIAALKSLIRNGIPGTEMPAVPLSRLSAKDLDALANWIWTLRKPEIVQAAAAAARGRELFHGKGGCAGCHAGGIGPDLSAIGARRNRESLKQSILEPEAQIADSFSNYRWTIDLPDNFLQVRLTTKQGTKIIGARVNEDSFSIQVRDMEGRVHSFLKQDLAELHKDWGKSPMPAYGSRLTRAEIEDLVAYLSERKGRP